MAGTILDRVSKRFERVRAVDGDPLIGETAPDGGGADSGRRDPRDRKGRCSPDAGISADAHGFSLHAGVRCGEHQRKRHERLCRTVTHPAIANERLKRDGAGNVVLQLKGLWREGTTHIVMTPLKLMQRLAAMVPRPRLDLIRFHGLLVPSTGLTGETWQWCGPQRAIYDQSFMSNTRSISQIAASSASAAEPPANTTRR